MANEQQLKETMRRIMEMFSTGNLDEIDKYIAQDCSYRATSGEEAHGLDEIREFQQIYDSAFSNMEVTPEQMYVEGNRGVIIYRQKGTHTGNFQGVEASNNEMNAMGCNVLTFDDDGKIVDIYDIIDTLEVLNQLDAVPSGMPELSGASKRPGGR